MRIISKFHDYYDGGMAFGQDRSVTYIRTTVPCFAKLPKAIHAGGRLILEPVKKLDGVPLRVEFEQAICVVARKGYRVFLRSTEDARAAVCNTDHVHRPMVAPSYFRSLDTGFDGDKIAGDTSMNNILRRLRAHYKVDFVEFQPYHSDRQQKQRDENDFQTRLAAIDFTESALHLDAPVFLMGHLFGWETYDPKKGIQERTDIVCVGDCSPRGSLAIVRNPKLDDFRLQTVLSPFEAFQEISQFIEGVVPGRMMPMVTLSDKHQIQKKGFDPVYGFRKRPASL